MKDQETSAPDKPEVGQIITFYSYKGGVGRSMAVANLATLLAHEGQRVLVLDFDLEAPGLHRYFLNAKTKRAKARYDAPKEGGGVIDFFTALRDTLDSHFPDETSYTNNPEVTNTILSDLIDKLLTDPRYFYSVRLEHPGRASKQSDAVSDVIQPGRPIQFMPAGRFDAGYPDRVRQFDWNNFYSSYAEIFPILADKLRQHYDSILIDSRTGITDIGSVCTVLLPDKLVLCFSPNEQSLFGAIEVGRRALQQRIKGGNARPLGIFPLPGRLENAEQNLQRKWLTDARKRFEWMLLEIYSIRSDLSIYFEQVRIPHQSYYAYGEEIAAEHDSPEEIGSLTAAFYRFRQCLRFPSVQFIRWSRFSQVAQDIEASLRLAQNQHDLKAELESYFRLGSLAAEQNELSTAADFYRKAAAIAETHGQEHTRKAVYHNLGNILMEQGDLPSALRFYQMSLDLANKTGDMHGAANTYHQLGLLAERQRNFSEALEYYQKSLEIAELSQDDVSKSKVFHQLGRLSEEQSKLDTAVDWYKKSLALAEKLGDEHGAAMTYGQLGLTAGIQHQYEQSGRWLLKALQGFLRTEDSDEATHTRDEFLHVYQSAPPELQERLRALWDVAGIGPFPLNVQNSPSNIYSRSQ